MKKILNKKKIVLKNNVIINNSISISFFKLDNIKSNQINYLRKISKKKSIKIIICKNKLLDIIFKKNNIPLFNIKNNNIILCHEENPSISLNIFKEFSKYNNINYKDYLNFIYFDKKIYKTDEEIEYISNISDIKSLLIKFCIILKNISIIKLYNTLKLLKKIKKMTTNKNKIIEELSKMSLTEINDLIIMIEKKFSICLNKNIDNIDNTEVNDNKDNEKKLFNIKLINIGNNKISVIKNIRSILNLGLKESKEIVESCPVLLKSDLNKSEAESFKKILEDSGASVILE